MTTPQPTNPNPGAGRDLDKLVAEKLGLNPVWHYPENPPHCDCKNLMFPTDAVPSGWEEVPGYSTEWNAAMQLYEMIAKKGCLIWLRNYEGYSMGYICQVLPGKNGDKMTELSRNAETGPHAIALAFLALPDEITKGK